MSKKSAKLEIAKLLAGIDKRRAILENAVQGVVEGFSFALFVWGPPGLGKSHLLTLLLEGIAGKGWRHHTAHSTPKALFLSLFEEQAAIHLFEDCERMLKTDLAASILRAACGAPNQRDRLITYKTAHENLRFKFTGGIIIATNANLAKGSGPLQGVASRFRPIRWDMSLSERIATIMHIANQPTMKGGVPITAKESMKVASRLVEMVRDSRCEFDLDIRLFSEHALPAFAQAKENPGMSWEDLLQAKLLGQAETVEASQAARTEHHRQLAQKIDLEGGTVKEKIAKWKNLTGLNQSIYYRHLKSRKQAP